MRYCTLYFDFSLNMMDHNDLFNGFDMFEGDIYPGDIYCCHRVECKVRGDHVEQLLQ